MSEVFLHRSVKAVRKRHQCHGCLRRIEVGEPAEYQCGVDGFDFWALYFCVGCREYIAESGFWEFHEDGCSPGDVREDAEIVNRDNAAFVGWWA